MYSLIQIYYLNKIDNNLKANENIDNISIESEIRESEKRLRDLPKKSSGTFTSQKEFAQLLTFLAQLLTNYLLTQKNLLKRTNKRYKTTNK